MTWNGWISTYWEQGMEESPWLIFQDELFTQGESWHPQGVMRLEPRDHLTIFAPDTSVLFQGQLETRRRGWFAKLYPGSSEWFPVEVGEKRWNEWFRHQPPLRARLTRE